MCSASVTARIRRMCCGPSVLMGADPTWAAALLPAPRLGPARYAASAHQDRLGGASHAVGIETHHVRSGSDAMAAVVEAIPQRFTWSGGTFGVQQGAHQAPVERVDAQLHARRSRQLPPHPYGRIEGIRHQAEKT